MKDNVTRQNEKGQNTHSSARRNSQLYQMWIQFKKHRLAMGGLIILLGFYTIGLFPQFFAPYDPMHRFTEENHTHFPPQLVRFIDKEGNFHFRPFVYKRTKELNLQTYQEEMTLDTSKRYPLHFFVRGSEYKLWNMFKLDWHLFGIKGNYSLHLFGTNALAQDLFSRNIHAMRISLSIGLVGVLMSVVLGTLIGGVSGYYGGTIDLIIQRLIETLMGIPRIPLWMALAAAIPQDWSMLKIYFFITIILATVSWTGLARNVRGKLISLRGEDFIRAARCIGASDFRIIVLHLLPNFLSYIIVYLTLAIPGMIIGETALSFLGIGLKPPIVSWGVLLKQAQTFQNVASYPWVMIPAIFVVTAVLCFNFVGDGLRDAADPFSITGK